MFRLGASGRRALARRCRWYGDLETAARDLEHRQQSLLQELESVKAEVRMHDLRNSLRLYASKAQTRLNLDDIVDFIVVKQYSTAAFLLRELPIRIASHVLDLWRLPDGLYHMPSVREVRRQYVQSFMDILDFPRFERRYHPSLQEEAAFLELMKKIDARHTNVMLTLSHGVSEFKEEVKANLKHQGKNQVPLMADYPNVQTALDKFFSNRIGTSFLVRQHISLQETTDHGVYLGLINRHTNLHEVARDAASTARQLCEIVHGDAPEVEIIGSCDRTLAHVPSHIFYMMVELLKNSLRAVLEHWRQTGVESVYDMPPIVITIADSESNEDVCIKIADQGGGIRQADMRHVWSYLYTTVKTDVRQGLRQLHNDAAPPMAGFGFGLPISRLYAQYFGGDLQLVSMEGYGTDAYLHIGRLQHVRHEAAPPGCEL